MQHTFASSYKDVPSAWSLSTRTSGNITRHLWLSPDSNYPRTVNASIPTITDAITQFPTQIQTYWSAVSFGLANQLAASTDSVATLLGPLWPLLSTKNDFLWTHTHDQAFLKAKQFLASAPTLAYFDPTKQTRLSTDASRYGLGFVLQQLHQDKWGVCITRRLPITKGRLCTCSIQVTADQCASFWC